VNKIQSVRYYYIKIKREILDTEEIKTLTQFHRLRNLLFYERFYYKKGEEERERERDPRGFTSFPSFSCKCTMLWIHGGGGWAS